MTILFLILIIIACVVLSLIVLVQNPKGGGLAGNVAGFSNQFMGVKQTTDVLEKGTWIFAAVIGILCIISSMFIPGSRLPKQVQTQQTQQQVPGSGGQNPGAPNPAP
jgi:preprotein translocase subunit SecG